MPRLCLKLAQEQRAAEMHGWLGSFRKATKKAGKSLHRLLFTSGIRRKRTAVLLLAKTSCLKVYEIVNTLRFAESNRIRSFSHLAGKFTQAIVLLVCIHQHLRLGQPDGRH